MPYQNGKFSGPGKSKGETAPPADKAPAAKAAPAKAPAAPAPAAPDQGGMTPQPHPITGVSSVTANYLSDGMYDIQTDGQPSGQGALADVQAAISTAFPDDAPMDAPMDDQAGMGAELGGIGGMPQQ